MKKIALVLTLALICFLGAQAQENIFGVEEDEKVSEKQEKNSVGALFEVNDDEQEIKTIFKPGKKDGFYGSFSIGYAPIDNKDGVTFSARGAWVIDHVFAIGLGGSSFINNLESLTEIESYTWDENEDTYLAGGYGGFTFEPILFPKQPVHLSFPVLVGMGGAASMEHMTQSTQFIDKNVDLYFVVEPMIELELNLTRHLRMAAYASYRYTTDIEIEGVSAGALRDYSVGLTFKAGWF